MISPLRKRKSCNDIRLVEILGLILSFGFSSAVHIHILVTAGDANCGCFQRLDQAMPWILNAASLEGNAELSLL